MAVEQKKSIDQLRRLFHDDDLRRLAKLSAKHEANLFKIIGAENRELHHSNFLQFLFNPSSRHPFGREFFELFCKKLGLKLVPSTTLEVERETLHIDLLLIDEKNELVIVIENKRHAMEGHDQLKRYRKEIESLPKFKGWTKKFYYLSFKGEEPVGDGGNWKSITYDLIASMIAEIKTGRRSMTNKLEFILDDYLEIIAS